MKKLVFLFIMMSIFSGFGFASQSADASPKVLEVFNETFQNPGDVKWFSNGDEFTAVFVDNNIRTSITYDKNANFLSSVRYYGECVLPLNVLVKIKEKYKAKKIGIVTELIKEGTVTYSVNLEDEKYFYVIESDGNAFMKLQKKFEKQ